MTKTRKPKYWKSKYTFERQGAVAIEKENRIKHLESKEHQRCMQDIREWNKKVHPN